MPLTVIVRSADPEAAITFEGPRVVIGRGASSDVRLPDPSVSQRHASVRIDAGVHTLVDEGSQNGTFVGGTRLAPGTPRVLKSGDLVRVGRVWLEVRIDQAPPTADLPNATRDLALALVSAAMRATGHDTIARVHVVEGRDVGRELALDDEGRPYVLGRGDRCDLLLDDPDASREHVQLVRRGSVVLARDLESKNGVRIGDAPIEPNRDVPWRPALVLRVGRSVLALEEPVARALADLEQAPDERIEPGDEPPAPTAPSGALPRARADDDGAPAAGREAHGGAAPIAQVSRGATTASGAAAATTAAATARRGRWSPADAAVVTIAVVVLTASLAGLVWLLKP